MSNIFLKKKFSKYSKNILDLSYNDNIFNKHDDLVSYTKEILPAQKEWFNSIYSYNKNYEKNISPYDKIVSELIKSFFNLHYVKNMKTKRLSWRKKRIRTKRLSINRILLSKAEILHTNKKAFFNLYVYNGEKRYIINKLKKINFVSKLRKKHIGRYITIIKKKLKKIKKIFYVKNKFNLNFISHPKPKPKSKPKPKPKSKPWYGNYASLKKMIFPPKQKSRKSRKSRLWNLNLRTITVPPKFWFINKDLLKLMILPPKQKLWLWNLNSNYISHPKDNKNIWIRNLALYNNKWDPTEKKNFWIRDKNLVKLMSHPPKQESRLWNLDSNYISYSKDDENFWIRNLEVYNEIYCPKENRKFWIRNKDLLKLMSHPPKQKSRSLNLDLDYYIIPIKNDKNIWIRNLALYNNKWDPTIKKNFWIRDKDLLKLMSHPPKQKSRLWVNRLPIFDDIGNPRKENLGVRSLDFTKFVRDAQYFYGNKILFIRNLNEYNKIRHPNQEKPKWEMIDLDFNNIKDQKKKFFVISEYMNLIKKFIKKSQNKSRLRFINRINRYKYLLWINKSKFENTYIYSLYKIISKYYDKKIEFNIINLKYLHLNSSILAQSLAIKIKNRKNKLRRVIKKFLKKVKLPIVNNKVKIIFRKKGFWLSKISNTSDTLTSINYKYLYAFFSIKNSIDFKNEQYDILNQLIKKKIQLKNENRKYLVSRILKTIKNKWVYGVRLKLSGRLTRRFVAARSISKINFKGSLKNIDSSNKAFPSVILRGCLKSNIQYSKISSKRKIGSFGVKGWISSL